MVLMDPKQREADENAAYAHWQQQVQAGVLLDSQKNRDAVVAYLSERNQFPSGATVQAAIEALKDSLDKPEVLHTLPNGEKQLPTDASDWEMKRASVAQLRDLSARRGEGRSRPVGGFGSKF
jgi:hypothetical protein